MAGTEACLIRTWGRDSCDEKREQEREQPQLATYRPRDRRLSRPWPIERRRGRFRGWMRISLVQAFTPTSP